jgi:hypothetical protein
MALKNLMARLKCRATDTPDTPEKITGYQRKAPIHAGCTLDTPDTPRFIDTPIIVQIGLIEALAANDLSPPPEPSPDPNAWRELAQAYHAHHFSCPVCIAAGRGAVYGLRCGVGAALWINYQNT